MKRKLSHILMILLILLVSVSGSSAQNPFFSKKKPATEPAPRQILPNHPVFFKLAVWQKQIKDEMAVLIERAREESRPGLLLYLLLMAFCYGVLHAAGPGHGKAVATTFMLSQKRSLSGGLLLGNGVAFSHGISGIVLVLAVHWVIKSGIIGPLETTTRITQFISHSLILLLGIGLTAKCVISWRSNRRIGMKPDSFSRAGSGWRMLPVAMTVGMIPCPGVVMVMLFTMSMNLIGLGIMLSLSIAAGMALTISIVVILVMYGKGVTLKAFGRDIRLARNLELGIKAMAGVLVAGLGGFLLIGTVYT